MILANLLLCSCVIQVSLLSQVFARQSPYKVGERGTIYYPGGPRRGYNAAAVPTTSAPPDQPRGSYQTYDLRALRNYDRSGEESKNQKRYDHDSKYDEKYSDYSRSSVEPVLYQKKNVPEYYQQPKAYPQALREYRVTDSHRMKQRKPAYLVIAPKVEKDWGSKDDQDWMKKADSSWDQSDEKAWRRDMGNEWNQKPANWDKKLDTDWDPKLVINWEPNSSERKTYKQEQKQNPKPRYREGTYETNRKEEKEEKYGGDERKMDNHGRQGYLIAQQQPRSSGRLVSRYKDPCVRNPDGQYVLNRGFKELFPYVDNICYFVKCANKKAFLNPCSPGTRNNEQGDGFCSILDLEGYCGLTVYDTAKKKKLKQAVQPKPDNNYHEYLHGTYYRS